MQACPFSAEPVLQIMLFSHFLEHGCTHICNYFLDEANSEHKFSSMNQQDGHLEFDPKRNNLISYVHGQLQLDQAKVAIA
jgi:hypothetical protein